MKKQYETVFILTPVLLQEQVDEAVAKYRKFLADNGAVIVQENNWGLRKLAYPIHLTHHLWQNWKLNTKGMSALCVF
jgi:small subunit ribosomal protein S6